ncbi:MAG: hypothetical protein BroJett040_08960 [Oligoflexia bacterium]|nr:MAG: hypothetical protein BroJett040_08960 [Oligoflexia bacterium]
MEKKSEFLLSSTEYFSEMVEQGFAKRNLQTFPAAKTYLVRLLEHYLDARNLFEPERDEAGNRQHQTLAELFLKANQSPQAERQELLKRLGDSALYISGFFGDSLSRKIVDIDYYAEMGGAAYASLAGCVREDTTAKVYQVFSRRFYDFVDVLTYISHCSNVQTDQNILRLYDRYIRTGSEYAREKLVEIGVITLPKDQVKLGNQD